MSKALVLSACVLALAACTNGNGDAGLQGSAGSTGTLGSGTSGSTGNGTSGSTGGSSTTTTAGGIGTSTTATNGSTGGVSASTTAGGTGATTTGGATTGGTQLPGEFETCDPSVGCSIGLSCIPEPSGGNFCVQFCQTTLDCFDPITSCGPATDTMNGCLPNTCGEGSPNGGWPYLPCNSSQSGDGTCYPTHPGALLCEQAGTTAANQPCQSLRIDGGVEALCELEFTCVEFGTKSACLPACALRAPLSPDGGPGCASGSTCSPISDAGLALGACLESCMTTSSNCPPPLTCQTVDAGLSVCAP